MGWLLGALARRVRAMLLADAAGWLEARFHARAAGRRAWLHAAADRHEAAGRRDVAAELRRRAAGVDRVADAAIQAELLADAPQAVAGHVGELLDRDVEELAGQLGDEPLERELLLERLLPIGRALDLSLRLAIDQHDRVLPFGTGNAARVPTSCSRP